MPKLDRQNVSWRIFREHVPEEPGSWAHNVTTQTLVEYIVHYPIPYMALVRLLDKQKKPTYYVFVKCLRDKSDRINLVEACNLLVKLYRQGKIIYIRDGHEKGQACVEVIVDAFLKDYDNLGHAAWAHEARAKVEA